MAEIPFTELRNHAKAWFDRVEAGEVVRVLRHGKPIAELDPVSPQPPSWKRRPARPLAIGGNEIALMILEERVD